METVTDLNVLRSAVDELRKGGAGTATIALVPTMGALHDGHRQLVREATKRADAVVASIFVNPTQFGPGEDLDAYPRQLADDAAMLENEGVALLWAPSVGVMYPDGFSTNIRVADLSEGLCGAARRGHFDGVATVVNKLFAQVRPDMALFGEKDFQQLAVIRRMARDLDLAHPAAEQIHGVATVREDDGLALSSRNRYLSARQRAAAASLPAEMRKAVAAIEAGSDVAPTLAALQAHLLQAGFASVDYATLVDATSLTPLAQAPERPARLLVAARIGSTRLIDNMAVAPV